MTYAYGDHPVFSPDQLAEIRLLAGEKWDQIDRQKHEAGSLHVRDALTERLLRLEAIQEQAGGVS